jgi:hypothetical protein
VQLFVHVKLRFFKRGTNGHSVQRAPGLKQRINFEASGGWYHGMPYGYGLLTAQQEPAGSLTGPRGKIRLSILFNKLSGFCINYYAIFGFFVLNP